MGHLWIPDIPLAEKLFRSAAVYFFLLIVIRLAGKRQVAQMTPFDLVVLLLISNVVQNAVIGNDNSLGGGLIGVMFILLLNAGVAWVVFRSKSVSRIVEGEPSLLVHNGVIMKARMDREKVTVHDLQEAMREHGLVDIGHVRYAVLEPDGKISILVRQEHPAPMPPIAQP